MCHYEKTRFFGKFFSFHGKRGRYFLKAGIVTVGEGTYHRFSTRQVEALFHLKTQSNDVCNPLRSLSRLSRYKALLLRCNHIKVRGKME
jgi:hypothetical protein